MWACAVAGDLTSYTLGRRLGRGFLVRHGAAAEDHRGAPAPGRGLLRPPRRPDDPDRALHRARARARAVHRGRVEDAAAAVPALRHPRRGPVVDAVLPARLLLLAVASTGSTQYVWRGLPRSARSSCSASRCTSSCACAATRSCARKVQPGCTSARTTRGSGWCGRRGPAWRMFGRPAAGGLDATRASGSRRGSRPAPRARAHDAARARRRRRLRLRAARALIGEQGEPRIDEVAFDVADALRFEPLTSIVEVFTHLGSSPVIGPARARSPLLCGAAAAALVEAARARRRRRADASPPCTSSRTPTTAPGPPAALARRAAPPIPPATPPTRSRWSRARWCSSAAGIGWAVRFALVTIAVVLVALVALSRVYLRAHYLSDVIGGVALGPRSARSSASPRWSPGPCVTMTRDVSNDDRSPTSSPEPPR